ncbi:MAG TPA: hypothetical protein DEB25_06365 [Desulfobulbaceae bacterium]|nr:hypothetical protein [Desulfobulbaceae bacterium]
MKVQDCPFCGDASGLKNRWAILEASDTSEGIAWQVVCSFCGGRGPFGANEEAAILAWNRRQP